MLTKRQFRSRLLEISERVPYQGHEYASHHATRLWRTFQHAAELLASSGSAELNLLTIGGGSCYVEAMLKEQFPRLQIRLLDFEAVIHANMTHYQAYGIRPVPGNILETWSPELCTHRYDVVLACEILEHLPIAPRDFFARVRPLLAQGGVLVVTTPNLGAARTILNLVRHRPIMPAPDSFFSSVCAENEGVHRREYLFRELMAEASHSQMNICRKEYILTEGNDASSAVGNLIGTIFPPYRRFMMVSLAGDRDQPSGRVR